MYSFRVSANNVTTRKFNQLSNNNLVYYIVTLFFVNFPELCNILKCRRKCAFHRSKKMAYIFIETDYSYLCIIIVF